MAQPTNPKDPTEGLNSSKPDFTNKLHSSSDASDANRDQNFDGTNQAGKDTLGDKGRTVVPADAAAESSQLTVNEMIAAKAAGPAGTPPPPQDGEVMVASDNPHATTTKYYRSSMPTFNFRYGRGQRAMFYQYWLKTNSADVQFYVEAQLMNVPNSFVQVKEGTEEEYRKERNIYGMVQPTFEPLPNQPELDAKAVRMQALSARAPRTAHNPDVLEPETGNAQQDHMTQFGKVQTDNLQRPIVDDRVVQASRNAKEAAAVAGGPIATDANANAPAPLRGGFTTGMQNSVGPGSAPRKP